MYIRRAEKEINNIVCMHFAFFLLTRSINPIHNWNTAERTTSLLLGSYYGRRQKHLLTLSSTGSAKQKLYKANTYSTVMQMDLYTYVSRLKGYGKSGN